MKGFKCYEFKQSILQDYIISEEIAEELILQKRLNFQLH